MKKIMATQKEILDALNTANQTLTDVGIEIDKVGTETDTLQKLITDLQGQIASGNVSQDIADAVTAVATQAGVVSSKIKAVDDKVPDSPITPTP